MISQKKISVYTLLQDMIIKLLFSIVMLLMLIGITWRLIFYPSWPLAFADTGTTTIMAIVLRHYFPRRDAGGD
jgi:hypothetical protein